MIKIKRTEELKHKYKREKDRNKRDISYEFKKRKIRIFR